MKARACILLLALLALVALAPAARAQGSSAGGAPGDAEQAGVPADSLSGGAPGDSLLSGAPGDSLPSGAPGDSLPGGAPGDSLPQPPLGAGGFHPSFRNEAKLDQYNTKVEVRNSASAGFAFGKDWSLSTRIYYDRDIPREVKREAVRTGFNIATNKTLFGAVPITLSVDRSSQIQEQNKGEPLYRRDESENASVSMSGRTGRTLTSWLATNVNANLSRSLATSRNNQGLSRDTQNGSNVLAGHLDFTPIKGMKLTTGYNKQMGSGTAELMKLSDTVESSADSAQVKVDYSLGQRMTLNITGGRYDRRNEQLDFERDQFNVVLPESLPVKKIIKENSVGGSAGVSIKPFSRLSLDADISFDTSEKRSRMPSGVSIMADSLDRESQRFSLAGMLKPWRGQQIDAKYTDGSTINRDFTAGREQVQRELMLKSAQDLHEGFGLWAEGYFQIVQDFYDNTIKNPQDRDQTQTRLTLGVDGKPTPWFESRNSLRWFESRDVYIQSSRSSSNKDRRALSWKSLLGYTFFKRYKVGQALEVTVTEEDFTYAENKNTLDREYFLTTDAQVPIHRRAVLSFAHEFRNRQNGGYRPDPTAPGRPKTFYKESRLKTETLKLGVSYEFRPYLKISCREDIGREVEYDYLDKSQSLSIFGNMVFTINFTQALGKSGKLNAALEHTARFGKFVRENQRSLWLPTLSIDYTF